MLEAKYCSRLKMRERERERLRKSLESNETCVNPYTLPRKDEDSGTVWIKKSCSLEEGRERERERAGGKQEHGTLRTKKKVDILDS
jgi:hypothetical protein